MSILSHNIYENIRTRILVLYRGSILLHPPHQRSDEAWRLPGGGLEPHESLSDCARREVLEETGLRVHIGKIAFLQEWVVPGYSKALASGEGYDYGLEVFLYAFPEEPVLDPRPESPDQLAARWIPLAQVPDLPLWPKQLKELCHQLSGGLKAGGCLSFVGQIESPWIRAEPGLDF